MDAIKVLMEEGEQVVAYITPHPTWDAGNTENWLKANVDIVGDPTVLL